MRCGPACSRISPDAGVSSRLKRSMESTYVGSKRSGPAHARAPTGRNPSPMLPSPLLSAGLLPSAPPPLYPGTPPTNPGYPDALAGTLPLSRNSKGASSVTPPIPTVLPAPSGACGLKYSDPVLGTSPPNVLLLLPVPIAAPGIPDHPVMPPLLLPILMGTIHSGTPLRLPPAETPSFAEPPSRQRVIKLNPGWKFSLSCCALAARGGPEEGAVAVLGGAGVGAIAGAALLRGFCGCCKFRSGGGAAVDDGEGENPMEVSVGAEA
mmetsp:Transcript_14666/g.39676  ORF Transcript_14666/g.39676 Transcript_14666/m.39676 type:complete len:265 (-) Transcript_14666:95-889(-)